jgi:hypothetical protein
MIMLPLIVSNTCDPTALASHEVTPIPSVPTNEHQFMAMPRIQEYPVRRTFSGSNADVWTEFLQYFENLAELNAWGQEKSRRVLLSTLIKHIVLNKKNCNKVKKMMIKSRFSCK